MPKRESNPKRTHNEYSYERLLGHIRKVINEEHGGVAKFVASDAFIQCGFADTAKERRNFYTYLVNQANEADIVKSVPVLSKLYKGLLNVDLASRIEVVRTQIIFTESALF